MVALADDAVIGQAALALEGDEGTAEHLLTCVRRDGAAAGRRGAEVGTDRLGQGGRDSSGW